MVRTSLGKYGRGKHGRGVPNNDQRPRGALTDGEERDLGPVERGGPLKPVIRLLVERVLGFGAVLGVGSPAGPRSSLAGRAPRPVLRSALRASPPALSGGVVALGLAARQLAEP